nr:MAG TPA: hypothetical protein [Caudoviricetes sp.]
MFTSSLGRLRDGIFAITGRFTPSSFARENRASAFTCPATSGCEQS